ncbi:MAG: hypothetical protein QF878_00090 [SAR202 cluster bacterium]|jgi:hypothetical protein|nr:hypothetical protein [SAR202 cluster bacterium]MDP6715073.1 hypothetical protein [SAR202 cluster bacterium]
MTGKIRIARPALITLVTLIFLGIGIGGFPGPTGPVSAQTSEESFEIFRGQSEPFELAVAVSPRTPVVGAVHFSVELLDAASQKSVTDARVLIVAHDEDDVPVIQTLAVNTPLAPDSYEGNLTFELPARWSLRIEVDSPSLGSATFRAPLVLRSGTPIENPMGTWIFLLVFAAIVGGTIYVGFSARKA